MIRTLSRGALAVLFALLLIPLTASATCFSISRTLSQGMRGDDVKLLQQFLVEKGYLESGSATGFYGALTESAVKDFQCKEGIICAGTTDNGWGVVGPKTRDAIKILSCAGASPSPTPSPAPSNALQCSLFVDDPIIYKGESAKLSWAAPNAVSGSISEIGDVATSGSKTLSPTKTTTYTGTFKSAAGEKIECQAAILVFNTFPVITPPPSAPSPSPTPPASSGADPNPPSSGIYRNACYDDTGNKLVLAASDFWAKPGAPFGFYVQADSGFWAISGSYDIRIVGRDYVSEPLRGNGPVSANLKKSSTYAILTFTKGGAAGFNTINGDTYLCSIYVSVGFTPGSNAAFTPSGSTQTSVGGGGPVSGQIKIEGSGGVLDAGGTRPQL